MQKITCPTQSKAWGKLRKFSESFKERGFRLNSLFRDSSRFSRFSLSHNHLTLDYSKNLLDEETLNALFELSADMRLEESIEAMFEGDRINTSEDRQVLHTALRIPANENPHNEVKDCLQRMEIMVNRIHSGKWKGFSGKNIKDIVNIGIGGSDLGPRLVCDALEDFKVGEQNLHFVSNVDPSHFDEVISELNPETTIFIVASKSFNTAETALNAAIAKKWLLEASDAPVAIEKHFIAITSNKNGAINFGVTEDNVLPVWDWVGGRYSVWSAIGLPVALSVGMESFIAFHAGAHSMDRHFQEESAEKNMPVIMALITVWYNAFFNCQSSAVVPYSHRLKELPFYLQQLSMESLGKSVTKENDQVSINTGEILWGTVGTNSQHSYFQLLHQGTQFVPIDFVAIAKTRSKSVDHNEMHNHLLANCLSQSLALMKGNSESEEAQKKVTGNKPSNTLLIDELNPFNLGCLIALYEHKVFVQSILWNINAFDQWGVELGKIISKDIYKELTSTDDESNELDSSTKNLIKLIKRNMPHK